MDNIPSVNSEEQKREAFRKMLREKAARKASPAEEHSALSSEEFDRFLNVEDFPEYRSFFGQFDQMEKYGLRNPFFHVNEGIVGNTVTIGGNDLISFAGYNYLGLSGDPRVSQKAQNAIDTYGTSVSASRPVSGEKPLHQELERNLASFLGTEDCIAYVGGHATNVTTIGHLFRPKDLIIYDEYSHNSILQGIALSGAQKAMFPHNDWQACAKILQELRKTAERTLIAIEGVYSMDGDIADLPSFIELKKEFSAWLMVDEAHSLGVLGKTGRGISEHFNVNRNDVDIWMGTLSKSLASCGGYIAGKTELVRYLKYTSPGFLYSVGMTPANAAAANEALHILLKEPDRVEKLRANADLFLNLARKNGLNTGLSSGTSVIPVIIGDSVRSVRIAGELFSRGINVQPIMYPAVSEDSSRLRFFITSLHTRDQIEHTVQVTSEVVHTSGRRL